MNYAIIDIGGTQQRVSPGDTIRVNRLSGENIELGKSLEIERVLMVSADGSLKVGSPLVKGAKVQATVMAEIKGKKVLVFKKKRTKQYRKTNGHRQQYTTLRIDAIQAG